MDKDYQNFVGRMGSFEDDFDVTEGTLQHYGKLGMHWGRRNAKASISKLSSKINKPKQVSEDYATKQTLKKKKIYEMSNAELQTLNTRLQLERSYKDLSKQDMSAGRKYVNDVLVNSSKQTVTNAVAKGMSKGLEGLLSKGVSTGTTAAASAIFNASIKKGVNGK